MDSMDHSLSLPLSDSAVRELKVGDSVLLSGILVTGRDAAHKWLTDRFIHPMETASPEEQRTLTELRGLLAGGAIYHCGPVVAGLETKQYRFVAAGPTTSIREEPYQAEVMKLLGLKAVIGKGGMGAGTLKAFGELPAVYLHAIGGAASLIAKTVQEVLGVYKLEFGVPEAMWVIRVADFPAVVTMDSHGTSLHDGVRKHSATELQRLLA
jgi:tartrate/fumarate subfamily iron-sulfur-dependent hydro-lyase beta chain